jgi:hypothetical protein
MLPESHNSPDPLTEILTSAPPEAWVTAVNTASDIVRDVLAPLTSTTAGLGRLIQAKFDGLIEVERVLAADTLRRTNEKILATQATMKPDFNPAVVLPSMEESAWQMEEEMRDLWANLLARELTVGGIHPELPRVLGRLTPEDAMELVEIAQGARSFRFLSRARSKPRGRPWLIRKREPSLSHEILRAAGLVERDDTGTKVTVLGRALLAAVAPYNGKSNDTEENADEDEASDD